MVRDIDVICRHVAGLGTLNGLTVEEEKVFERHVRASGLTPSEWIRSAGGRGRKKNLETNSSPGLPASLETESGLDDLGFWDDQPGLARHGGTQDDDDDEVKPCPVCGGRGKDAAGNTCAACNGSGKVLDDENDDEEDVDDERRDEDED
jgi:hypothetical protein